MGKNSVKVLAGNMIKKAETKDKILVSLTSYPARIKIVYKSIETLLCQTLKPDKIILWLTEEEFPNKENDLPIELLNLQENHESFEIAWCENLKPYKKLIPALEKYSDFLIITADDDLIYEPNRIELLYKTHLKYPHDAICHRAHFITFNNKEINDYSKWIMCCKYKGASKNLFPTTGAMVLYPQNCFYKDVLSKELFFKLSYNTDDIWFWAMCVLNGTKIRLAENHISLLTDIENSQKEALWYDNVNNGNNDKNLKLIFQHYPILLNKLSKRLPIYYSIRNIFAIINSDDRKYKIVTIFGFKIKIRRKNAKN